MYGVFIDRVQWNWQLAMAFAGTLHIAATFKKYLKRAFSIFNRPCVAGAVLQTLINWPTHPFPPNL